MKKTDYKALREELYRGYQKCCDVVDSCVKPLYICDRYGNIKIALKADARSVELRKDAALETCESWLQLMRAKVRIWRYDYWYSKLWMKLTGEMKNFQCFVTLLVAMTDKFRDDFAEESDKFDIGINAKIGF